MTGEAAARLVDQAISQRQQGRYGDAIVTLDRAVAMAPDRCQGWVIRGQIMLEHGAYRDALASFDRALAIQPDDAGTLAYRGDTLRLLGQFADALGSYHKAVGVDPVHARALNGIGLISASRGQPREALTWHDRAIAANPDFAEAHNGRGIVLSRLGQFAAALACFTRALTLWPGYADAHVNTGNTLRKMGRFEEALISLDHALALDPGSVDGLYARAGVLAVLDRKLEALAACDRALRLDANLRPALMLRGTLLGMLGRYQEAVEWFDRLIAQGGRPDVFYADAHIGQGNALRESKRLPEAIAAYDRALALFPTHAGAWYDRGRALREMGELQEAVESYTAALESNPRYLEARNYLSSVLATLGRNDEAEAQARLVLSISPTNESAHNNLGNALQRQGRLREAVASFEAAMSLVPDPAGARFNRGMCLLLAGDFENGWRDYEVRTQVREWDTRGWDTAVRPAWRGQKDVAGQRIMLYSEQGFGDTIQFCRYAPMVAALGAKVLLHVRAPLRPLLESLDPAFDVSDETQPMPRFDQHCSIMSLPFAFRTELATIPNRVPYLAPPEELRMLWRERLGPRHGPRIGLAWSGNDKPYGRAIPLEIISPLVAMLPEVYCIQRELRPGDVPALAMFQGIRFFGRELRDFADTAALLEQLDLIISIDSSVMHLAGALARPTWAMLPFAADWRWLKSRDDSPWYPTVRLFRQPTSGDWTGVIDRVRHELTGYLGAFRDG